MKSVARNGKRLLALALTLLLCAALLPTAALAAETAETMRLEKFEGTVTVKTAGGANITASNKLRLLNGYKVETSAASYAWVSLDGAKALKLDANTSIELSKSGSRLEIKLNRGALLADVKEKVPAGSSMNIRTSSGVCGIRGTIVYAEQTEPGQTIFGTLEGSTSVSSCDETGSAQTLDVSAGQTATLLDQSASGQQGVAAAISGTAGQALPLDTIRGFAQVEIAENGQMQDRIRSANSLELGSLTLANARGRLAADEGKASLLGGLAVPGGGSTLGAGTLNVNPTWGVGGQFNESTTVYFDANGGTGYMAPITVTSAITTPDCTFTRAGYTFIGWKDAYGTDYPVGRAIQGGASGTYAEITLYAQWKQNETTGGGGAVPYVPVTPVEPEPKPDPKPEPVPVSYTITVPDSINCAVEAEGVTYETKNDTKVYTVAENTEVTLTYTNDEAGANNIQSVYCVGQDSQVMTRVHRSMAEGNNMVNLYSFKMPAENLTVYETVLYHIYTDIYTDEDSITADNFECDALALGEAYYAAAGETITSIYKCARCDGRFFGLYAIENDTEAPILALTLQRSYTVVSDTAAIVSTLAFTMPEGGATITTPLLFTITTVNNGFGTIVCSGDLVADTFDGECYYVTQGETVQVTVTLAEGQDKNQMDLTLSYWDDNEPIEQNINMSEDFKSGAFIMPDENVELRLKQHG